MDPHEQPTEELTPINPCNRDMVTRREDWEYQRRMSENIESLHKRLSRHDRRLGRRERKRLARLAENPPKMVALPRPSHQVPYAVSHGITVYRTCYCDGSVCGTIIR